MDRNYNGDNFFKTEQTREHNLLRIRFLCVTLTQSIICKMLKRILGTFFPRVCGACGVVLSTHERVICTECLHHLPFIEKQDIAENLIKKKFYGRLAIHRAAGLLFYHKKGLSQHLMHQLKYYGDERISRFLGQWLSGKLENRAWMKDIDLVVPVPLHKKRKRKRGYNQVEGFARAFVQRFNCEYGQHILTKTFNSSTQVFKNRWARTELKGGYFALKHKERIRGKHILLVDDIITTGSTLETCGRNLLKGEPAKLSLATMAITV